MLRVGRIDYANCTPLFIQLEEHVPADIVEIVHGVPATLNAKLASGEIDLCISSSIEFSRHSNDYAILPGHCIGSTGPVKSVLFFTRCPVEQLAGKQLFVTSESATSVVLLQILLAKRWGVSGCTVIPTSLPFPDALQQSSGLLLIGDKALKAVSQDVPGYCYDLGHEWQSLTGLPFVYALWLINRAAAQGKDIAMAQFKKFLDHAHNRIIPDAELLAAQASESVWFGLQPLADYWRSAITYKLDADHLAGLQRFYFLAAELGLIPTVPELVFHTI